LTFRRLRRVRKVDIFILPSFCYVLCTYTFCLLSKKQNHKTCERQHIAERHQAARFSPLTAVRPRIAAAPGVAPVIASTPRMCRHRCTWHAGVVRTGWHGVTLTQARHGGQYEDRCLLLHADALSPLTMPAEGRDKQHNRHVRSAGIFAIIQMIRIRTEIGVFR
jgi:hypothetical protein